MKQFVICKHSSSSKHGCVICAGIRAALFPFAVRQLQASAGLASMLKQVQLTWFADYALHVVSSKQPNM